MQQTDIIIIGGGIVGLATAYQFTLDYPLLKITLLEKEQQLAAHQTGHNSGVLHTGIYYKPGSLKALNCLEGKSRMEDFCRKEEIDFEICGKVIVAIFESELPALEAIYQRGRSNGVSCEMINSENILFYVMFAFLLFYVFKNLFLIFFYYWNNKFCWNIYKEVSNNLLKTYISRPITYYFSKNSSELINNTMNECKFFSTMVQFFLRILC